jgi:hypothetical protein
MNRLLTALAISTLTAPAVAQEPPRAIGSWVVAGTMDAMTDERSAGAVNTNRSVGDRNDPAVLIVSCPIGSAIAVSLRTEGFWPGRDQVSVTYRIDQKPAVRGMWSISPISGQMVHVNNDRALLAGLRQGAVVRFRVDTIDGTHEAAFELDGAGEVIPAMEKLCGSLGERRRQKAQVPKGSPSTAGSAKRID